MEPRFTDNSRFIAEGGALVGEIAPHRFDHWFVCWRSYEHAILTEDNLHALSTWLLTNCGDEEGRWRMVPDRRRWDVWFRDQDDAFAFKMRWC